MRSASRAYAAETPPATTPKRGTSCAATASSAANSSRPPPDASKLSSASTSSLSRWSSSSANAAPSWTTAASNAPPAEISIIGLNCASGPSAKSCAIERRRSLISPCASNARRGKIIHFGSRSKPSSGTGRACVTSGNSMNVDAWLMRVVGRTITGVRYASDSSNAASIMAHPSSGVLGSSTGTFAKDANRRVSCSVWEEIGPGSSATNKTVPPLTPI